MIMKAKLDEDQSADTETYVNLCNHTYWNLSSNFSQKDISNHHLRLPNTQFIELGNSWLPTGNIKSVEGSLFDFREMTKIGANGRLTELQDAMGKPGLHIDCVVQGAERATHNPEKMNLVAEL